VVRAWLSSGGELGSREGVAASVAKHGSAIACIELAWDQSDAPDAGFALMGIKPVAVHGVQVRRLIDQREKTDGGQLIDEALVCRWSERRISVCVHGGGYVTSRVLQWLAACGADVTLRDAVPHQARFGMGTDAPTREDAIRARLWQGLSACQSKLGCELLGKQLSRWLASTRAIDDAMNHRDLQLMRLMQPPLVAAVGASNIGKSSLLNALAKRDVALVHDAPGTTRDYVGALLELDGMLVRWVDTPGWLDRFGEPMLKPEQDLDARAYATAMDIVQQADLIVACGDHQHEPPWQSQSQHAAAVLHVQLRGDLGQAKWPRDATCSLKDPASIETLARTIRQRLVSDALIEDSRPWRWWPPDDR
jgi:small GTP-binding protein